jgi:lysine N6-hydroxylase
MTAEHDVVAIGCGPFNLGLAALASRVEGLDLVAFEARPELRWHSGLMFDDARLQLSFLADLVTLVDPTHPLSFLAYVHDADRMWPFFIREALHPTRREYEDYLRWAAARLPAVRFSHRVTGVEWDAGRGRFAVHVEPRGGRRERVLAKDLVIGIGTEPAVPAALAALPAERLLHSAEYLHRRRDLEAAERITVVGSGQSAAEIMLELLRRNLDGGPAVTWLTRTPAFAPLDYTKLVLEMTTPAYVRYFHGLPQAVKDGLNREHWRHYKGISTETIEELYELLYRRRLAPGLRPVELRCGTAVESAGVESATGDVVLECRERDTGALLEHATSLVVAATGYRERHPAFLAPLEAAIARDEQGRYRVRLDYSIELAAPIRGRIFVANAELHSHGVATPDLGMGAFRGASILNAVTGRERFRLPKHTAFTSFGVPAPHEAPARRSESVHRTEPVPAPAPASRSAPISLDARDGRAQVGS